MTLLLVELQRLEEIMKRTRKTEGGDKVSICSVQLFSLVKSFSQSGS